MESHADFLPSTSRFPLGLHTQTLYKFKDSPIRSTRPLYHILLDLNRQRIYDEERKSLIQEPITCLTPEPDHSDTLSNEISWSRMLTSFHLRLGFPLGFHTQTLYKFKDSPICSTRPLHHILLDLNRQRICDEERKSRCSPNFKLASNEVGRYS